MKSITTHIKFPSAQKFLHHPKPSVNLASYHTQANKWQSIVKQPIPPKILSFHDFDLISRASGGRHEVWKSLHKETKKYFYLKRITPTIDEEYQHQMDTLGKVSADYFERKDPQRCKFEAEREITASRLVRLFCGEEGYTPEVMLAVHEHRDNWPYYWIASQEIPHFISLDTMGKRFFVNDDGKTCLWLNDNEYVETFGRIRTKFALIATGEADSNPENIGISGTGLKRLIASIDHELCLTFPHSSTPWERFAQLLASGQTEAPQPIIDLKTLKNIRRRDIVRQESIGHIAECFRDSDEISRIFMESFSWHQPFAYRQEIRTLTSRLYDTGFAFVAADILLKHDWDRSPEMAKALWKLPENTHMLESYAQKNPCKTAQGTSF